MSEALDKMVAAMVAEFERQIDGDWQNNPVGGAVKESRSVVYCDGQFDMKLVARAGLGALKSLPDAAGFDAEAAIDAILSQTP